MFLAGSLVLVSASLLFSRVTWGGPLGAGSLPTTGVQQQPAVQDVVRAKRFVLVDEVGATVGAFGVFDGQLSLLLHDKNQKARAVLAVDKEGQPALVLLDENGKIRAQFDIENNEPRLMLLDEKGKTTFLAPQ